MVLDHCGEFNNDARTNSGHSQNKLQFCHMFLVANAHYVLAH